MVNLVGEGAPNLAELGCSRLLLCVSGKDELRDRGVWYYDLVRKSGWKGEVKVFEMEGEKHAFHILCEAMTENVKIMIIRLAFFLLQSIEYVLLKIADHFKTFIHVYVLQKSFESFPYHVLGHNCFKG